MRPLRPAFALSLALAGCGPDKPTSSASDTTTDAPVCQASEDCPDGQACLWIVCNGHGVPGCPFIDCVVGCALPGAATPTWSCVDNAGCCGDAVCENGFCVDVTATGTASTSATTSGATTSTSATGSGTGSSGEWTTSGGTALPVPCGDGMCAAGSICVHPGANCVMGEPDTGETCQSIPPDNTCDEIVYPPPFCAVEHCPDDENFVRCLDDEFCESCFSNPEFADGQLRCAPQFCHCGAW
jgi:hypothetical protein